MRAIELPYYCNPLTLQRLGPHFYTMTRALSKAEASHQQLQQQEQYARDVEIREHSTRADASAGLNLNLFGALSGAFSSKSRKATHSKPDGSSTSVEDKEDKGMYVLIEDTVTRGHWLETPSPYQSEHAINSTSNGDRGCTNGFSGAAQGYAQGQGSAFARGSALENTKHEKSQELGQGAHQGQKKAQRVDHLGIER